MTNHSMIYSVIIMIQVVRKESISAVIVYPHKDFTHLSVKIHFINPQNNNTNNSDQVFI